ncbi:hypothetical protein KXS12_25995 [Priestia filamentosa]|uniref:hypothetical protein n=1 Tax=Priestia filamentosa TaxID=1402861 RepID=UPI003F1820D4
METTTSMLIDTTYESKGKEQIEISSGNTFNFWLYSSNGTLQRQTIYKVDNAELRIGYYQGVQYGLGRFTYFYQWFMVIPFLLL